MNTSGFRGILLAALLLLGTAQSAHAILAAVSPEFDPQNGYPVWYQDTNGRSATLCLEIPPCLSAPVDPADPNAVALGVGEESFYWGADADIASGGVNALLVMALEAAFLNGAPVPGEQMVFGRIRIRIDVPAGTPVGTWTIDHPFGQEVFNNVAPGINAINFTSDIGCGAAPCDFSLALQSGVGPLLQPLAGQFEFPVGSGVFYFGDGITPQPIEPGPNGAIFRVRGPGIDLQTPNFTVHGKVFAGVLPTPLTLETASYTRTATSGTVTVVAHGASTATMQVSSGPAVPANPALPGQPVTLTSDLAGSFFAHLTGLAAIPTNVSVTSTVVGAVPSTVIRPLRDVVSISEATFNLASNTLTVRATSSDQGATLPTLSVAGFGAMTNGLLVATGVVVPPGTVIVNSSAGGSDTHPVSFITETLNITFARLARVRPNLTVRGTSTVAGPGNIITIHLGGAAGPVIGTAAVDAAGNFAFFRARVPAGLRPARAGGQITAVSSSGAEATAILPFP